MSKPSPALWGVPCSDGFAARHWDSEAVVFVESTGEIHRLSPVTVEVWQAMLARPGSFFGSTTWLYMTLPGGGDVLDEADLEAFERVLQELVRTGLAARRGA